MGSKRGTREFLLYPEAFSLSFASSLSPGNASNLLEPSPSEQAQRKASDISVSSWQVSDVLSWLKKVCPSYAEYRNTFESQKINGVALISLNKSELRELVTSIGDRARIWHGIMTLRQDYKNRDRKRRSQVSIAEHNRQQLRFRFSDGRETVMDVDDCSSAAEIMRKALRITLPVVDRETVTQWAFVSELAPNRRLTEEEVMELARNGDISSPLEVVSASTVGSRPIAYSPAQRANRTSTVRSGSSSSIATVTADAYNQDQNEDQSPEIQSKKATSLISAAPRRTASNASAYSLQRQPLATPSTQSSGIAGRRNARRASLMSIASNASVASVERPTSQYVSMNLHEYFPDASKRELADTVRRSVLFQRRLTVHEEGNRLSRRASNLIAPLNQLAGVERGSPYLSTISSPQYRQRHSSLETQPVDRHQEISRTPSQQFAQELVEIKLRELKLLPDLNPKQPRSSDSDFSNSTSTDSTDQGSPQSQRSQRSPVPQPLPRSKTAVEAVPQTAPERPQNLRSVSSSDAAQQPESEINPSDQQLDELAILENQTVQPSRWIRGRLIGSGSFGTVYMGINLLTGELMAVKQVEIPADSKKQHQRKMVETLRHEISLMQNLDHENIVQYRGFESDNNHINIFLEYVPGGSLASLIAQYGAFEEPLTRHYARQTLMGLAYLHEQGIIHRDIKGANVLVNDRGLIKISDFGLSKKVETQQLLAKAGPQRQSMQGSAFWMAPEIVNGKELTTPKADIWSFGCLLIELVTGTHPFPTLTQMQAIFKVGNMQRPTIPESISSELKNFLEKSLEIQKDLRPSAKELLSHPFLANP